MIQISATDFKQNLGKYLSMANQEDIHIMKNGESIAVLTAPPQKASWVDSIVGIIPEMEYTEKQLKKDRLAAKYEDTN